MKSQIRLIVVIKNRFPELYVYYVSSRQGWSLKKSFFRSSSRAIALDCSQSEVAGSILGAGIILMVSKKLENEIKLLPLSLSRSRLHWET